MNADRDQRLSVWLSGLRRGDADAQAGAWEQVFERVVQMARRKLESQGLERRTRDEEDIALSAIRSLFHYAAAGKFEQFECSADLWKLLARFTTCKIHAKRKFDHAEKRGGAGEERRRTLGESALGATEDGAGIGEILGDTPPPDMEILMNDAVSALPPKLHQVAVLRLEGLNDSQIAGKLDVSVKTVHRRMREIEQLWRPE